jgi:hypothetical protein
VEGSAPPLVGGFLTPPGRVRRDRISPVKRLGRWAFNILAGVSLMLCVAACVLWARSHERYDSIDAAPEGKRLYLIHSHCGQLWFEARTYSEDVVARGPKWQTSDCSPPLREILEPGDFAFDRWGFAVANSERFTPPLAPPVPYIDVFIYPLPWPGLPKFKALAVPHWALAVCLAAMPTLAVLQSWRCGKRRQLGLCPQCSYDLRATPDRCPECGTARVQSPSEVRVQTDVG